ncbi:MAG: hypothetical protein M1827_001571 [Pycnora praestabilis]|nr:MAG: hypothetical protein M1827_001571 [Pycnora praestabilis]
MSSPPHVMRNRIEANSGNTLLILLLVFPIVVWYSSNIETSPLSESYTQVSQQLPNVKASIQNLRAPATRPPSLRFNESKLALLIEPSTLPHTTPLLLHMITVVPPDWRFLFLGSWDSVAHVKLSRPLQSHIATGKLDVQLIPRVEGALDQNSPEHLNRLFTNTSFYDTVLSPAEWLFVFHTDSILCANSNVSLNEWLDYDWVGRSRTHEVQFGGSGGLSLRRISRLKQILSQHTRDGVTSGAESKWLIDHLKMTRGIRFPTIAEEMKFTVESVWYDRPMGYHIGKIGPGMSPKVWDNRMRRAKIFNYCPEIKMIMNMRLDRERCPRPLPPAELVVPIEEKGVEEQEVPPVEPVKPTELVDAVGDNVESVTTSSI